MLNLHNFKFQISNIVYICLTEYVLIHYNKINYNSIFHNFNKEVKVHGFTILKYTPSSNN